MVKSLNRELETIALIAVLTASSLLVLNYANVRPRFNLGASNIPSSLTKPIPQVSYFEESTEIVSPDGRSTILMDKKSSGESTDYSFTINDADGKGFLLFSKSLALSSKISVPLNTFSPDNKNIFLKEDDSFYVWSVSDGSSLNISQLFSEKLPDLKLLDITGWAAPGLLIVNTQNPDGEKRSYWFEVPSQSFIQLATNFYD